MARAIAIVFVLAWTSVAIAEPALVKVRGRIVDQATNEPVAGVTVIGALPVGDSVAISDETGSFDLDLAPSTKTLTYFFMDKTVEQPIVVVPGFGRIDLGTFRLDTYPVIDCVYYWIDPPGFMLDYSTAFDETFNGRWPVARSRDVDALIPLAATSRSRMPTMLDGGWRLAGAPAVALGLLQEAAVYTMRGGEALEGRADGVALASRAGSNENHGDARVELGSDGLALEAGAGGPIVDDKAWWWAGTALGDGLEQVLARLNYARSLEQQGQIVAMHQVDPNLSLRTTTTATSTTDDWANASWVSKWNDNKLQLTTGATGERLDDGLVDTTRAAARAELVDRFKVVGIQEIKAYGEVGEGELGDIQHRDASASARDRWSLRPDVTVEAGVRWDERWFGASRAQVWQPQALIGWDWTREGRSEVFVSQGRASLLDDYGLGGWVDSARWRDDLATGVRYELADTWIGGVALRDSDTSGTRHAGIDATLDHRTSWFELHVTATSVERAVAGWGRLTLEHVLVSANGRWAAADDPLGSFAGASLAWRHRFHHQMDGTLGGEVVRDREGTLGRAVVAFSF